ncbi:LacI family DNA-binding transcriptional regulator [Paenarthrobacter ureafaciens]|uniref:LacI family DNA-binding transcriptional regulator n=1 Tax=Paenarthrobacter ureafaciens TaxID=37931 RepID=UPI002DBEBD24|nr:LacI family DNA-binding transcriptional regulator [Paenarthrobacter ureafaciens]MEC3853713.1 LacI family DNA-binding transcriptional regulator [Paenarthrobacter ureafaciens]
MPRAQRVTASDVAKAAGVSKTTVSYVLNQTPNQSIPEHTRLRVLEAVRELDYTSLAAARALRIGRNDTVLFVLPDWPLSHSLSRVIEQVTEGLAVHGLSLLLQRPSPGRSLISLWRELAPAALMTVEAMDAEDELLIRESGTVVVAAATSEFGIRQDLIGAMQAEYLAGQGHRHLAYARVLDPKLETLSAERWEGFRNACHRLGLNEPLDVGFDLSVDGSISALKGMSETAANVTGMATYNDQIAAAVLAGMRRIGKNVPADLAVVGVDDEPFAQFAEPPLTTVRQNHTLFGRYLADRVASAIGGEHKVNSTKPDVLSLIVRESA